MTTSLQRTYRNLRLVVAGSVVLIGVAVVVTSAKTGVLGSVSAYYYTPARAVFVGALIASAAAILALSGRGVQRALLDAAALVAPVVAVVPTTVREGSIPGVAVACASGDRCIPSDVLPDVAAGVTVYLIAGSLAVAFVAVSSTLRRDGSLRASLPSLLVAAGVLGMVFATWMLARPAFLAGAHLVAAVVFFALIAAVAVINAVQRSDADLRSRRLSHTYGSLAVAMVVDLLLTGASVAAGFADGGVVPPVFVGEAVALALFVVFWGMQSAERWHDSDPAVR